MMGVPDFLRNLEAVVKRMPNYEERITALRERMKKFAELRAERTAKTQAAMGAS
jgi:hypothetical protein